MNTMIKNFVFVLLLAMVGVQSAFALRCEGAIYFKAPADWSSVYLFSAGRFDPVPKTSIEDGWYKIDASKIGMDYYDDFVFTQIPEFTGNGVTTKVFNEKWYQEDAFSCAEMAQLYIFENPVEPESPRCQVFLCDDSARYGRMDGGSSHAEF